MDHYIDAGELDTSVRPSKKKKKPMNSIVLNQKGQDGKCCGNGGCTIF